MTDDQLRLANAYLDGDVDDDERARAEADPEVMAEVARLRDVAARLRSLEPPDAARRERAIAAALAAGSADDTGDIGRGPVAPPVPMRPRRAWWAGAAVAAAVVVIVIGGIAVLRANPGGGDDDSLDLSLVPETAGQELQDAAAAATTAAGTASAGAGAPSAAESSERASTESTSGGTFAASASPPADTAVVELDSPGALAAFASSSLDQEATAGTSPPSCTGGPGEQYVGPAIWSALDPPVTVEVFIDGGDAVARDATTCAEVARAPLG
jgi:hypothetical protein